jgi:dCMP deaminase
MNLALSIAEDRSKDPSTQVGCVIVDKNMDPVAFGYNGFGPGAEETEELWQRPVKYDHVIHAETNAVGRAARRGCSTAGCIAYITAFPCLPCAKVLIAAGIKEIHALKLVHGWDDDHQKAAAEFDRVGIQWHIWTQNDIMAGENYP